MQTVLKISLGECCPVITRVAVTVEDGIAHLIVEYQEHKMVKTIERLQ